MLLSTASDGEALVIEEAWEEGEVMGQAGGEKWSVDGGVRKEEDDEPGEEMVELKDVLRDEVGRREPNAWRAETAVESVCRMACRDISSVELCL